MPAFNPSAPWLEPLQKRLDEILHPVRQPEGKARLLETLTAIGELLARHRQEMPNDLVHYLERRSYEKAAVFCAQGGGGVAGGHGASS